MSFSWIGLTTSLGSVVRKPWGALCTDVPADHLQHGTCPALGTLITEFIMQGHAHLNSNRSGAEEYAQITSGNQATAFFAASNASSELENSRSEK